ncbi:N-6 DNA methylase [Candidatus Collierbacteria bacterium]|nr:N-6 DNA methylase [Candidatus Collierbacteria bacterium]
MPGTKFKNQVDNLMNILFGAGVASHATIIEQINYLVFLRSLSKKDDSAMILDSSAEKIFSGELAKYHWDNLLVLNAEVLFTTLEEIFRKLPELATDQTVRLLFRDAHVKVFDKPTLRRLVHEIEKMMSELEKEASSGHTDIFGDMYEYLLSKQAQAGTLGQFRTPRHIIKFIVDIIDPSKGETILDPACGTAGFLVSALEHLKEKYTSDELKTEGRFVMDKLKKEERDFVYQHTFTGFDSDFDMFKFGLMNLYLHKLEHPNIKRQNTLVDTAGDRTKWDIILANPPFAGALDQDSVSEDLRMGTRATEVLFLKYIIDHLSQNGRAGVIVPEGVVFNSTTAHKKIRQMLIEDAGLWCVVSLPSGVFNPYAGVKTSILFFDKTKKDKNNEILFIKVENDGFELGAQRKQIEASDLPSSKKTINNFNLGIKELDNKAFIVKKTDIISSGNYLLSGDKYRSAQVINDKWPTIELGQVLDYEQPTKYIVKSTDYKNEYTTPVLTAGKTFILGYTNETEGVYNTGLPVIIFDDFTTASKFVDFAFKVKSSAMKILHVKKEIADPKYIYYVMRGIKFSHGEHKRYWISEYSKIKIPLPPLEIQQQIVEELVGLEDEIKFNEKETESLNLLQNKIVMGIWKESGQSIQTVSFIEKNEIYSELSNILKVLNHIQNNQDDSVFIYFFESIVLALREVSYLIEKYFSDSLDEITKNKIRIITKARNAICHRSSPLNYVSIENKIKFTRNIARGKINLMKVENVEIKSEYKDDVAVFYGNIRVYVVRDVKCLYDSFIKIISSSKTNHGKN